MPDQSEVTDLESQIAELQRNNDDLRRQVGGQNFGAGDSEDTAAALTNVEENEAILATLRRKLESLTGEAPAG